MRIFNRDAYPTFIRCQKYDRKSLLDTNCIDVSVVMHRHRIFAQQGGFSEELASLTDWDLILRYTRHKGPACAPFYGADDHLESQKLNNNGYLAPYEVNKARIYEINSEQRIALGLVDDLT